MTCRELAFHPQLALRKQLLSGTLERPIPQTVLDRPKQGFTLPFERWMSGDLAPFVRDGMRTLASEGWVAADAPDRVWTAWRAGLAHWSHPWALGVLGHVAGGSHR